MALPRPGSLRALSTLAAWQRGILSRGAATIRRKLILLHTLFSLLVAAVLLLALRPPIQDLLTQEELRECRLGVELLAAQEDALANTPSSASPTPMSQVAGIELLRGEAGELGIPDELARRAKAEPSQSFVTGPGSSRPMAVRYSPATGRWLVAIARSPEARSAIDRVYLLLAVALLGVYAAIAIALEIMVLPRQVYGPIALLRAADEAVQAGRRDLELIPEPEIPADELGDIMRSRNKTVSELRKQEQALADALTKLENAASELKRKNHLLETARRNLTDQDRLASLGMMSAGIAHELNTPLAVLKGCVEQLAAEAPRDGTPESPGDRAALMLRVVSRLERLSESLLDFARVRPPKLDRTQVRPLIEEAWTLVSLDRDARGTELVNNVPPDAEITADADRLTQVFVNLLRNAVDAMEHVRPGLPRRITVREVAGVRDARRWRSIIVTDTGPGIEPTLFPRLFEPFASTRLDSTGTGLGLAVAEGIIREHGGVLLARNTAGPSGTPAGAEFEVMLPEAGPAESRIDAEPAGLFAP